MTKNTTVSVRVTEETKKEAEKLLDTMGLTMSTAVNLFLKQVIITGKIPFELKSERAGGDNQDGKRI